jgi:hypothetical protein
MPNNKCELHTDTSAPLGYTARSDGQYSTYSPMCRCVPIGEFEDLPIEDSRKDILKDAYDTISKLTLWDWLAKPDVPGKNGFVGSTDRTVAEVSDAMSYTGHSGSSFAYVMRAMELIAKRGWDYYVDSILFADTCGCRAEKKMTGWCGVAGGGVPACDH